MHTYAHSCTLTRMHTHESEWATRVNKIQEHLPASHRRVPYDGPWRLCPWQAFHSAHVLSGPYFTLMVTLTLVSVTCFEILQM